MSDWVNDLRAGILEQAIKDYRKGSYKQKEYLESWFMSEWGQEISGDHGDFIVTRLRKENR